MLCSYISYNILFKKRGSVNERVCVCTVDTPHREVRPAVTVSQAGDQQTQQRLSPAVSQQSSPAILGADGRTSPQAAPPALSFTLLAVSSATSPANSKPGIATVFATSDDESEDTVFVVRDSDAH